MKKSNQKKLTGKQHKRTLKVLLVFLILSAVPVHAQEAQEILVKEKLNIEFKKGHGCMSQSRAATKEEALYNDAQCGGTRYELSKKGKRFRIFDKNNDKWVKWGEYRIVQSLIDEVQGDRRYVFIASDGSKIVYVPKGPSDPLVITDLVGQELIHYTFE